MENLSVKEQEFMVKIEKNLQENGFPDKNVSFPTEKLYEAADNRGVSLNKVLDFMGKSSGIDSRITSDKIFFSSISPEDSYSKAQEMLGKMTPEQMSEIKKMMDNLSDEEKQEMMKKGKEMGLI